MNIYRGFGLVAVIMFFLYGVLASKTQSATEASVAATVTAQNISVGVSDATITYGVMGVGTSKDTTNRGGMLNDSQVLTNDGNITENINIRGQNSANWTLAVGSTAGSDIYTHKWCTSNCDSAPTWNTIITTNGTLQTSVGVGGTLWFDLQLGTPTSSSNYTQQSVDVTIQAVAP
ncbi:hypothetical protein M1116_02130 [Patescibacteria group bacterium]|nr:hypothetical protein [Patescibacteria group bacterium]